MLNQLLLNEEDATHARAFAALLHEQAEQSTMLRDEQFANVRLLTTLEEFVAMMKGQQGGEGEAPLEADKENLASAALRSPPPSSIDPFRSPAGEFKTPRVHHQSVVRDLENVMEELTAAQSEVETLRAQLKAEREGKLLLQHKQHQLKSLIGRLNDLAEDVMVSDEMDEIEIPLTILDKKQSKKRGRRAEPSRNSSFEQNDADEEEGEESAEADKPSNKRRRSQYQPEEQPVMMLTRPQPVNREEVEALRQGRAHRQSLGPRTPSLFEH